MLKQISINRNKTNKRGFKIPYKSNVCEFEEVHWMSSGLSNCDGFVDVPFSTILFQDPIYNVNVKEAEIIETVTVEDSDWDFHFHQRYLHLKKYL